MANQLKNKTQRSTNPQAEAAASEKLKVPQHAHKIVAREVGTPG
jgi:hypothetical protein